MLLSQDAGVQDKRAASECLDLITFQSQSLNQGPANISIILTVGSPAPKCNAFNIGTGAVFKSPGPSSWHLANDSF